MSRASKILKLCEGSANPLTIEYITRDLFKGKSVSSACKSFIAKFNGQNNMFLGNINMTQDELEKAVFDDKADYVIKNLSHIKPGMEHIALDGAIDFFKFNTQDAKMLKDAVVHKLGRNPF